VRPQVRISPDGRGIAWRRPGDDRWIYADVSDTYNASSDSPDDWEPLVAATPLLAAWEADVAHCLDGQPLEACAECAGLTLAIESLREAAQR